MKHKSTTKTHQTTTEWHKSTTMRRKTITEGHKMTTKRQKITTKRRKCLWQSSTCLWGLSHNLSEAVAPFLTTVAQNNILSAYFTGSPSSCHPIINNHATTNLHCDDSLSSSCPDLLLSPLGHPWPPARSSHDSCHLAGYEWSLTKQEGKCLITSLMYFRIHLFT